MSNPVLELVVYRVKNPETAATVRAAIRPHLASYPGFLGWQAAVSMDDGALFAARVSWESLDAARSAGQKVVTDPVCAGFMAEIGEIFSMGHFAEAPNA